jgi:biopolymer transport protein ExbD
VRFPRRRPDAPALELAPLVDVLFLLLVFFMVASRFPEVPAGFAFEPAKGGDVLDEEAGTVRLVLSHEGALTLSGTLLPEDETGRLAALRQARASAPGPLLLAADRRIDHGQVVAVLTLAEVAGFTALSLETQLAEEPTRGKP